MIQNKHIINSLPLLAAALGRKYGVEVVIGGDRACTDGRTIHLPSLPQDCDATLLGLVRGYIDHESAHLRETDFSLLRAGQITPLEKHIWNILEDWRVENRLSSVFPGCRQNLNWLIRHIFLDESMDNSEQPDKAKAIQVLCWMLFTVRSWDVPELADQRDRLASQVEQNYPGLIAGLAPVLDGVPSRCRDTADCLVAARELAGILALYLEDEGGEAQEDESSQTGARKPDSENIRENSRLQLENLLNSGPETLPLDMGTAVANRLGASRESQKKGIGVATAGCKLLENLDAKARSEARAATNALRSRLQGLLQAEQVCRNRRSFYGRLDACRLHRVCTGDARIFLGRDVRQGLNTAVHILLDSSGSMHGRQMELASAACFAAASALHSIPGVNLAVTAFPGNPNGFIQQDTVVPILKHGQKLHNRFQLHASGSTPMDFALWWVLQQMLFLPEARKIILLISDGEPDRIAATEKAVQAAQVTGHEICGIGIDCSGMQRLLPQTSQIIRNVSDLAPAMFRMLQDTLLAGKRRG